MLPLTDYFLCYFALTLRKKGLKHRSHKACFEEPSCFSVHYKILGQQRVLKGILNAIMVQHMHNIVCCACCFTIVIVKMVTKCFIEQKVTFLLRSDVLLCKHTIK